MFEYTPELLGDLRREIGWDGISDLHVLLRATAVEEVVVRKGLKAGSLADGETAALGRIGMNEVMPVFRDVASDRG